MAPETPRGVSSRLLSMKFMQRAAASSSAGSPNSDAHSTKKRKLGHSTPEGRIDLNFDQAAIKAALDDQEAKRQAALEKNSGSDTHWVLNNSLAVSGTTSSTQAPMNIVYVGYGDIDSSNESDNNEDTSVQGRTSTRNFKSSKTQNQPADTPASDAEDSSDAEESEASDEPTPGRKRQPSSDSPHARSARSRSRSRSQSRHNLENAKAKEFREKRKKREVKLSKLTSISSGGGNQFSSPNGKAMICYKCQQPGHKAVDCPNSNGRVKR